MTTRITVKTGYGYSDLLLPTGQVLDEGQGTDLSDEDFAALPASILAKVWVGTPPVVVAEPDPVPDTGGGSAALAGLVSDNLVVPQAGYYYSLLPVDGQPGTRLGSLGGYAQSLNNAVVYLSQSVTSLRGSLPQGQGVLGGAYVKTIVESGTYDFGDLTAATVVLFADPGLFPSQINVRSGVEFLRFEVNTVIFSSWTGGPAQIQISRSSVGIEVIVSDAGSLVSPGAYDSSPFELLLDVLDIPQIAALPGYVNGGPFASPRDTFAIDATITYAPSNRLLTLCRYGDYNVNTGPCDVIALDPFTGEVVTLYPAWDTERIDHWRILNGGYAWATSIDPSGGGPASLMTNWSVDGAFRRIEIDLPSKRLVHCWDTAQISDGTLFILGTRDLTAAELATSGYAPGADSAASVIWKVVLNQDDFTITLTEDHVDIPLEPDPYARATSWGVSNGILVSHSMFTEDALYDTGEGIVETPFPCANLRDPDTGTWLRKRMPSPDAHLADKTTQYPSIWGNAEFSVQTTQESSEILNVYADGTGDFVIFGPTKLLSNQSYGSGMVLGYDQSRFIGQLFRENIIRYNQPSGSLGAVGALPQYEQSNASLVSYTKVYDPDGPPFFLFTGGHKIYRSGYPSTAHGPLTPLDPDAAILAALDNPSSALRAKLDALYG